MKSTFRIIWTNRALSDLNNIVTYLEKNWTVKEIQKFARLLDFQLNRLVTHPFLFPESNRFKKIRKSVLTRQISIYYRVLSNEIQIISLFDNRQNPVKLNKL